MSKTNAVFEDTARKIYFLKRRTGHFQVLPKDLSGYKAVLSRIYALDGETTALVSAEHSMLFPRLLNVDIDTADIYGKNKCVGYI